MTLQDQYNRWKETTLKKSLDKFAERKKKFETTAGIEVHRVALPGFDTDEISARPTQPAEQESEYLEKLNFPGEFPFTRGVQPTMYRSRFWTMRQYAGFSTAEESNKRYRYLLNQGQTGLSVAFDLPTQIGYDADDAMALGEVGKVGVSISSVEDMARLFDQIPLDKVSTSMTINAPAGVLLAMYIAVAKRQGVEMKSLRGTIQNDILKEYVARGHVYISACAFDATHHRYLFVLHARSSELEHHLSFGLSHPRSRFNCGAGSCVHAGEWNRVRGCRSQVRTERGRVRTADILLLQRA